MTEHSVEALTPDSTGRWLVRTRRTTHLFDLDTGTYTRMPNPDGQAFALDATPISLARIDRWPEVGQRFLIWFDDPDMPNLLEHWRASSVVQTITAAPADEPQGPPT